MARSMNARIEDYGLIGNTLSAALVSRDGSIDWLCLPRFDSGAVFASLLGTPEHGRWQIRPNAEFTTRRRYRDRTLTIETDFETSAGVVRVADLMLPHTKIPTLVRVVEGLSGDVEMAFDLALRFDYGQIVPWVSKLEEGIHAVGGPDTIRLRVYGLEEPLQGKGFTTVASFAVRAGQKVAFVLRWHPSYEKPPEDLRDLEAVLGEVDAADRWWRDWTRRCTYDCDYADEVMRSLITLKALTHCETGGIVAAPTTSLPECLGGVRNWDYRYCWLRDATFTLYAFITAGYMEEAQAWRDWLTRAVAGKPGDIQIMYGLAGERRLHELILDWLPGYEGSKPVRIGNAAHQQLQLDVYGELMDAFWLARLHSHTNGTDRIWRIQRKLIEFLDTAWREPDEGIWEVRGSRRHFTHSKVMTWVAFDRAVKTIERHGHSGPAERWRETANCIRAEILEKAYDSKRGTFVQYYGARALDASLLMIPLVGFLPWSDPRVVGTVEAVQRELMNDGFLRRYNTESADQVDGLPEGEGAFLACSFWLVDCLALLGRKDQAREMFERLLSIRNDLGLLAEEYDVVNRRLVGNFPQAFSHVALINSARGLSRAGGPAEDRHLTGGGGA